VHYEKASGGKLRLVYEDNGGGIALADKPELFSRGYGKGTGYGLYLAKEIMKAYGWTIKEAGKPGRGARFIITIPKTNRNGKINYRLTSSVIIGPSVLPELEGVTVGESE
jgi:signal transduction histidine kinase